MFDFGYETGSLFTEISECNSFHGLPPNVYIKMYIIRGILSRLSIGPTLASVGVLFSDPLNAEPNYS